MLVQLFLQLIFLVVMLSIVSCPNNVTVVRRLMTLTLLVPHALVFHSVALAHHIFIQTRPTVMAPGPFSQGHKQNGGNGKSRLALESS
jgi:hypothetical protein